MIFFGPFILSLAVVREYVRNRTGAQCPKNPPPPEGLKLINQKTVTPDMMAWAKSIVFDPSSTFEQTFSKMFGDRNITARVEHHPWTTHGAEIIYGCYKGVTLYEQPAAPTLTATAGESPSDEVIRAQDALLGSIRGAPWLRGVGVWKGPDARGPWSLKVNVRSVTPEVLRSLPAAIGGVRVYVHPVGDIRALTGGAPYNYGNQPGDCGVHPWRYHPDYCKCILAGGSEAKCRKLVPPEQGQVCVFVDDRSGWRCSPTSPPAFGNSPGHIGGSYDHWWWTFGRPAGLPYRPT